jgi:excisionase family DNA binding protein
MSQSLLPEPMRPEIEAPARPRPTSPGPPLLLSIAEAAACLGISRAHFYEILGQQHLPTIRLGRRRMVRARDLESFVASLVDSLAPSDATAAGV